MDHRSCVWCLLLMILAFGHTDAATVRVYAFEWTINPLTIRTGAESDVRVRVNVTSSAESDNIGKGRGLWRVGIFGSQNRMGFGPKYDYRPQILDRKEQGRGLKTGKKMVIDIETKFNLRGLGPTTAFPYMCVEFTQGDAPRPPFTLLVNRTNNIVSCQKTPPEQDGDRDENVNPLGTLNNALFSATGWMMQSPSAVNPSSPTRSRIILIVRISPSSDSVQGRNLWKASLYASHNSDGSGRRYFLRDQILSEIDQSRSLDNQASNMTFDILTEIELYGINCYPDDPVFLCVAFAQGENRNYNFPLHADDGITECQEIECKVPGAPGARPSNPGGDRGSGLPRAIFQSMSWSTDSYSVSETETSRVTMHITAGAHASSDRIRGSGLWEVRIFGSGHPEGSGPRFNQARNILSQRQENMQLSPGGELAFDVEFDFMMGQIGCGRVNYLCVELAKGPRARPDFEIDSPSNDNARRTCQELACQFSDEVDLPRAIMTNIAFAASSGDNQPPPGRTNMDITATVAMHTSSDMISGRGLWRLGVYGSREGDGSGRKLNEMRNILSDSTASSTLVPGRDLVFTGNANLNLQGIGTGQDHPYFCMEFAKGDNPDPDFDLPMSPAGRTSIVSCSIIQGTPVAPGRPQVSLSRFLSSVEPGQSHRDGTTDLTVEATVTPHPNSATLHGESLWQLGIYGSPNEDGSGRRYPVSDQIIQPPQTDMQVRPGRNMEFSVTDNFDIRAMGPGTSFPYICVEFGKSQYAAPNFDFVLGDQDSVVTCHLMSDPDEGGAGMGQQGGGHGSRPERPGHGDRPPRALISSFSYELATAAVRDSHLTDVEVTATLIPYSTTDTIEGDNLWRLGLYGSRHKDGQGPRMGEVRQLLDSAESRKTLRSGPDLIVEGTTRTDLRGIGVGTEYPYVCVEFGPASRDPFFAFPVNPGSTLVSCTLHDGPTGTTGGGGRGGGEDRPQVLLSRFQADITPSAIPDSHLTRIAIQATVVPNPRTDYVPEAQFRLGIFGNAQSDGTGSRVNEVRQILPAEDRTHPVYEGRNVEISATADVDLRGMGTGTRNPYLCVEFDKKNDYVDFDMPMSSATGTFIICYEFTEPDPHGGGGGGGGGGGDRPVAQVSHMRNALEFLSMPGSNLVETTVTSTITPHSTSDRIPASGSANWRLGIFGSINQDGSGTRKKEVPQLLSGAQQRLPMYPSRSIEFVATNELDLSGIGTGTNYPYLCFEFAKAEGNRDFEFPQDSIVTCSQFNALPVREPEPDHQQVTVTEVVPAKGVKGKEKGTADVRFDVVVSFDSSSDQVHGPNLWNMRVWSSKKKNGKGPKLSEVPQVLSQTQQQQTIQSNQKITFSDVSMTLDLNGVKCKDAKYLCAEIHQGSSHTFTLEDPVIGCQKMKCQKKSKTPKPPRGSSGSDTTLAIRSIAATRVTVFHDREYSVRFETTVVFDASQSQPLEQGVNLWKLSAWFNSAPDASNKYAKEDRLLPSRMRSKYVRDVSTNWGFPEIEFSADLRDYQCSQLRYFCVKLTADDPSPSFNFEKVEDGANVGCARTTCR